ncbi:MAG: trigger factor [Anaerolineae bacterium]|nr:trigger factor [Candidatus Roseilinea sp.]MDW8449230.1 trigger factor [Anaerolineae bacterium]
MNFQVETLDTHEVRLTITVDDDVVNRARRDVARELSKQVRIPGFRPGHAPMAAVIRAVGGQDVFDAEVVDRVAREVYPKALDEAGIDPYGPGQIEEVKQSPYQLIARVPLEPKVDLKDYKSIRLPVPSVVVTEEEIEQQLQFIREENAIVQLAERPAEMGDLVDVRVVGKRQGSGEEVLRFQPRRGMVLDPDREALPGLSALIVGMSAGEHKDATLTLPDDFDEEELRGKQLDVSIDVQRVSSRTLPDINDELAQTASAFSTLAELREDLRRRLTEYKQRQADQEFAMQALDAFTALAEVHYPPAFVEDRLDDLLQDFKDDVRETEGLPFEEWLKVQGKTEQQVREELRPIAEQRSRRGLVMRELSRVEGLNVSEEEIAAEVELTARRYGSRQSEVRRVLAQADTRSAIRNNILSSKVLDRMVRIAKGELSVAEPSGQPAEPEAAPAVT